MIKMKLKVDCAHVVKVIGEKENRKINNCANGIVGKDLSNDTIGRF